MDSMVCVCARARMCEIITKGKIMNLRAYEQDMGAVVGWETRVKTVQYSCIKLKSF